MSEPTTAGKRRREPRLPRWLRVPLLVGLPILAPVICWMVLDMLTGRKLKAVLADIRARGWPTEVSDLYPAPIPDSENAATVYRIAFAELKKFDEVVKAEVRDGTGKLWWGRARTLAEWETFTEEQRGALRAWLSANQDALALVHKAAQMEQCQFDLKYKDGFMMVLPHLAGMHSCSRLEGAAVIMGLAESRSDQVMERWLDMVAMVRHQGGQKVFFAEQFRLACLQMVCEALQAFTQNGTMGAEQVQSALAALDGLGNRQSFSAALQGELVFFHDFLRRGLYVVPGLDFSGGTTWKGDLKGAYLKARALLSEKFYWSPFGIPWRQYDAAKGLSSIREIMELLQQPFYAVRGQLSEWEKRTSTQSGAPLTRLLLFAWGHFVKHFASAEARVACARTALALEWYRLRHGEYPATLDAVVPEALPEVPLDPFDGKPLRYINDGKRVVVYSVGENLQDDGGEERSGQTRGDIVFTLRLGGAGEGAEGQKP